MFLNKTFQIPKYLNAGSPLRARVSIRPYKFNTSDVIRLTLTWGFRLLHLSTSNRLSSLFRVHLLHFTSDSHQSHLPLILRGHIFFERIIFRDSNPCFKMGRKFFVGGNWKMNGDKAAIEGICNTLKSADTDSNVGELLGLPLVGNHL